jgi:hypothetical protein
MPPKTGGASGRYRRATKAMKMMKQRVRRITRRTAGRSIAQVVADLRSYLVGWKAYFRLSDEYWVFKNLDKWVRRRLRALHLKHWRTGPKTYRALRALGVSDSIANQAAGHNGRWWRYSAAAMHNALPTRYFEELGVPTLYP